MNRLTALVMLVCFIAQQFACCCDGCGVATCGHEHHAAVTLDSAQAADCGESECSHDHSFQPHPADGPSHPADESDGPCDHSHQHHLCFASHVVFTGTPRAELPQQDLSTGWACLLACSTDPLAILVLSSMAHGVDSGPPLSTCPQRSALCVYRI